MIYYYYYSHWHYDLLILDNRAGKTVIFVCPGNFQVDLEVVRQIEYMKTLPDHSGGRCWQFIRPGPF